MADITSHPWMVTAENTLGHLAELQPDWDSYGAPVISVEAIAAARAFIATLALVATVVPELPEPSIVPTCGGGVQVEWSRPGGSWVDVEFTAAGTIDAAACDPADVEWEFTHG